MSNSILEQNQKEQNNKRVKSIRYVSIICMCSFTHPNSVPLSSTPLTPTGPPSDHHTACYEDGQHGSSWMDEQLVNTYSPRPTAKWHVAGAHRASPALRLQVLGLGGRGHLNVVIVILQTVNVWPTPLALLHNPDEGSAPPCTRTWVADQTSEGRSATRVLCEKGPHSGTYTSILYYTTTTAL